MPFRPFLQRGFRIFAAFKSWRIMLPGVAIAKLHRRRFGWLFLAGLWGFAMLSLSCEPNLPSSSAGSERVKTGGFKVAMVLPTTKNDGSWSQAGFEGLKLLEKELGAQIAYTEKASELPEPAKEEVFDRYAREGFNFVIGHGGEFLSAIEKVAKKYPRVKFSATTNCPGNNINQGCLIFRSGELGYLTGAIAAMKSQSRKVAFIGGVDYSHMKERANSFVQGAKAIDPNIQAKIEWAGTWTDRDKVGKVAEALIQDGTDIIAISAEPAEERVFKMARKEKVWLMGWDRDRAPLAPDRVITSALQDVPKLMLQGGILVQSGRWQGKQYKLGIKDGVQMLTPFRGTLTAAQEAKVKAITEEIFTDKLEILP
ncbi:BMP family protein [Oscillatoria sp. FACHB-1406]|uniref:BMP family protein n=1 Tax=Oscillatoria sp. FACHB-1406 TaxID=2692846 RepID=UPI00168792A8|nr:BMP family protein [Oscillatoria sp. FACHB-1406]MBD2576838.1 BMP family protein [Oscillatoria sp. FACHB-1406]